MRRIEVPDENLLPAGPARWLTEQLHQLYRASGRLGLRLLSDRIRDNDNLPATVSHETIRKVLSGSPARWPTIQALVWTLAANAHPPRDPDAEVERFLGLWEAAESGRVEFDSVHGRGDASSLGVSASTPASFRRLDEVLLNTVILVQDSTDLSDVLDPCFAAARREENRAGWRSSGAGGLNFGAQENWELKHHGHRVGHLLWTRDKHGDTGWEVAVPDGYGSRKTMTPQSFTSYRTGTYVHRQPNVPNVPQTEAGDGPIPLISSPLRPTGTTAREALWPHYSVS